VRRTGISPGQTGPGHPRSPESDGERQRANQDVLSFQIEDPLSSLDGGLQSAGRRLPGGRPRNQQANIHVFSPADRKLPGSSHPGIFNLSGSASPKACRDCRGDSQTAPTEKLIHVVPPGRPAPRYASNDAIFPFRNHVKYQFLLSKKLRIFILDNRVFAVRSPPDHAAIQRCTERAGAGAEQQNQSIRKSWTGKFPHTA